jgi:hypothetical protein
MSPTIPDRARRLAGELELKFAADAAFATELNNGQCRLRRANDRLWPGLHPDGMAVLYGECPAAVGVLVANDRSEVLSAADPLRQAQEVHWTIHQVFLDYQTAAERRRHVAAEVGELAGELIATLVAAGWSEQDARAANVHKLARTGHDMPRECRPDRRPRCRPSPMPRDDDGQAAHS